MNVSRLCFLVIFAFTAKCAEAQLKFPGGRPGYFTPTPNSFVDVPSPTAASLGRYGDFGVSSFTGSPNISVPIYEFDVRGLKLPVSLEYDATGIMPNSLPSWAGQNWTLNVGGVITRTMRGEYDEWKNPRQAELGTLKKFENYFSCHGKLDEYLRNGGYNGMKEDVMYQCRDFAPDEFSFHFMGKSGKFFLDRNGNWKVSSNENLEVICDINDNSCLASPLFAKYPFEQAVDRNQPKTIGGFVIRDEEGYRYIFGKNRNAIEYTTNFWRISLKEDTEGWHASGWYLTEVRDKYGNRLYKLDYNRGAYVIQVFNAYYDDQFDEKAKGWLAASFKYGMDNLHFPYTVSICSPVYLSTIDGLNGVRAVFNSMNVGDGLSYDKLYRSLYLRYNGINGLYNKLGSMADKWQVPQGTSEDTGAFYYLQSSDPRHKSGVEDTLQTFRYNSPNDFDVLNRARLRKLNQISICHKNTNDKIEYHLCMSEVNNRLRLDSLLVTDVVYNYDKARCLTKTYRFRYNSFDKLPSDYLTTCVDHWGYYNGVDYYKGIGDKQNFYNYRNSNADSTALGVLTEIVYPTGGVTDFEYELNTYGKCLSNDRQSVYNASGNGGGLRIKSIKSYDSAKKDVLLSRKDYSYNIPNTGVSSGELFATPLYYWKDWNLRCEGNNVQYHMCTFHTSSIVPLANSTGIPLGYSYVTESIKETKMPFKTMEEHVFHYSNVSDPAVRDQRFTLTFGNKDQFTPYDEWSELGFKKGLLLNEETYDGRGRKIEATGYKYRNDNYLKDSVLTSNLVYECYGNSSQYAHYLGGVYKLYYPKYDVVAVSDTVFNSDGTTKSVTSRSYDKRDISYRSDYLYNHEVDVRLVQSETTRRGAFSECYRYTFGDFNAVKGNDYVLYKQHSFLKPLKVAYERNGIMIHQDSTVYKYFWNNRRMLLPSVVVRENAFGIKDTLVGYSRYSNTGLPVAFKEKGQRNRFLVWGANDCYLVMDCDMAVNDSIPSSLFYNQKNCLGYLKYYVQSHQQAHITGYVWNPLFGPVAIIRPNEDYTTYRYDNFGRLSNVYDRNGILLKEYKYNYRK